MPVVWYTGAGYTGRRFFVANYQGSIIATTDSTATLQHSYQYGPYGEPQIDQSATGAWDATTPRFRYTGQTMLYDAKLYYYKARVYDPVYRHFMQTDPIGTKDDLDLHAYTGNDPVNKSDPAGNNTFQMGGSFKADLFGFKVGIQVGVAFDDSGHAAAYGQVSGSMVDATKAVAGPPASALARDVANTPAPKIVAVAGGTVL